MLYSGIHGLLALAVLLDKADPVYSLCFVGCWFLVLVFMSANWRDTWLVVLSMVIYWFIRGEIPLSDYWVYAFVQKTIIITFLPVALFFMITIA